MAKQLERLGTALGQLFRCRAFSARRILPSIVEPAKSHNLKSPPRFFTSLLVSAKTVASRDDFCEALERGSVSRSTMVGDRQWSLLQLSGVRHCCGSQSRAPVWLRCIGASPLRRSARCERLADELDAFIMQ